MKLWSILGWLFIFIVGSLIVNFILDPSAANRVKQNTLDLIDSIPSIEKQSLDYSNLTRITDNGEGCANLEWIANGMGANLNQLKEKTCEDACTKINKKCISFNCEGKNFVVYCSP